MKSEKDSKPSGDDTVAPGGFLSRYGVEVDPDLLRLALSHRSWAVDHPGRGDNERLEFLGDSVLGLVITTRLCKNFPNDSEGEMSKKRAALVSEDSLAQIAKQLNIGQHLRLGRGERRSGGADKASILSDALEAIIGAVYRSNGFLVAEQFVNKLFAEQISKIDELTLFFDPKTVLQEEAAARDMIRPEYEISEEGPNHDRLFKATVELDGFTGRGTGTSKKAAEIAAARQTISKMLDARALRTVPESVTKRAKRGASRGEN